MVMNGASSTPESIRAAVAQLGDGPLEEAALRRHVAPLFSRVLARNASRAYFANHSLGRPLDATEDDVREALAAWYADLGGAWNAWAEELAAFRARLAHLLGASRDDCIVPKISAGAGLRAVLNRDERRLRVVATRGEFDSLDVILREYAHRGRIALTLVEPREGERFEAEDIARAIRTGADLVVISQVMFRTGQVLGGLDALIREAHAAGAQVLLDVYHALGVFPVDVAALDVDFAVGGSYKYLRGGPGACFLYVCPREIDRGRTSLDIGWFAKEAPFRYERPDPPRYAAGGDAWMESTPPILTWYQARAGQVFTQAIGVARLRAYSLIQQRALVDALAAHGVPASGAHAGQGAFVVVRRDDAATLCEALRSEGIDTDARGDCLRLCPDVLTTTEEIQRVAGALGRALSPTG
jgi:kynureninase